MNGRRRLLDCFKPDEFAPAADQVNYGALYAAGMRGLLFDIDNTLVPHGAPATPEAIALMKRLKGMGFHICLLSNNRRERVKPFARALGVEAVWKAHKPSGAGLRRAQALMGCGRRSTCLIGDQLFTDIWCARRAGIRSVLVDPIDPREEVQIVLKRIPERVLLRFYRKNS